MKLKSVSAPFAGLALVLFGFSGSADAFTSTATSTFQVKIKITDSCIFSTGAAADLDFGTTGVIASNLDQTSTIMVQCTNALPYEIGLNGGSVAGNIAARQMKSVAGGLVNYSLYYDSGRTKNWGDTTLVDRLAATGTGAAVTHTVYGRVPSQTTPAAGNYADTVTVTVYY